MWQWHFMLTKIKLSICALATKSEDTEGTSAVIQSMECVSELKYCPGLMMLDLLCVCALHIRLSTWYRERRRGNASLGSSYLISIELLNLYKDHGRRRYICMFWFLMKTTWTHTHATFGVKGVKVKKMLHCMTWVQLFKLGFTFFYATYIHLHVKFKVHTKLLGFLILS